jgi:hypothetical protein
MSGSTILFLLVRVVHVLLAATWLGMTAFASLFLMPAFKEAGPGAAPVAQGIMRRKLDVYMASLGGTVVLTGFFLYWRFTGGFDPALSGTRAARVFGAGGMAGLLAVILGGAVVARNVRKMTSSTNPAEIASARDKAMTFSRIVLILQAIAAAAMAVGHYV